MFSYYLIDEFKEFFMKIKCSAQEIDENWQKRASKAALLKYNVEIGLSVRIIFDWENSYNQIVKLSLLLQIDKAEEIFQTKKNPTNAPRFL